MIRKLYLFLLLFISIIFIVGCGKLPLPTVDGNVNNITIRNSSFSYESINVNQGIKIIRSPIWINKKNVQTYVIEPALPTIPTGYAFNTNTGNITVPITSTKLATTNYTITATNTTTTYKHKRIATISITINDASSIDGTMTYVAYVGNFGTAVATAVPTWAGSTDTNQTVTYTSIVNRTSGFVVDGISIDTTGKIIISNTAPAMTVTNFTVTAVGTGNYGGTVTGTASITINPKSIATGYDFSYADTIVGYETSRTIAPATNTLPAGVRYAIKGGTTALPTGITLNPDTGVITIAANTTKVQPQTTYTIQATGQGNYKDTKTATVKIEITQKSIVGDTFTYTNTSMVYEVGGTISPNENFPDGATVTYSVTSTFPAGIDVHFNTGVITIAADTNVQAATTYTIMATATNANYTGFVNATINIKITPKNIASYTFTYGDTMGIPSGTLTTKGPTTNTLPLGSVTYARVGTLPFASGITMNTNTGEITIPPTAALQIGPISNYHITATAKAGSNYTGTKDATISIKGVCPTTFETAPADTDALGTAITTKITAQGNNANLNVIDTSQITKMEDVFKNNTTFNGNIACWDVSNVTNMTRMFLGAAAFNGDISKWHTSSVENMFSVFGGATVFNQDIRDWNVSNVTNMQEMFASAAAFNQNIAGWDVSKVRNMKTMFEYATAFNQDLSGWNVGEVRTYSNFALNGTNVGFTKAKRPKFLTYVADKAALIALINPLITENPQVDLNRINTIDITDMSFLFQDKITFNGNISNWNTSNVTNMRGMFLGAYAFNGDISNWNTSKVTNMRTMFFQARAFNQDIKFVQVGTLDDGTNNDDKWNTSNVTIMKQMFDNARVFNQNISNWNVDKVTNHDLFARSNPAEFTTARQPTWP